jgi:hypothetical protein
MFSKSHNSVFIKSDSSKMLQSLVSSGMFGVTGWYIFNQWCTNEAKI